VNFQSFRFSQIELPPTAKALRMEVRAFLDEQRKAGVFKEGVGAWFRFSPEFSRAMGAKGWIGMTWPTEYGGAGRTALERHIVTEEMLSAGAPTRAHWVADRQSGPLLLRFGTEEQKRTYLPRMARGECYFCIGMSEPDSGSDLASIRTKATKVQGGWRVEGSKLWTSNAHRAHMMILFVRTSPRGENRHAGLSQFLVDLSWPGITVRPIINLAGEHDFNEVHFDSMFVPDNMLIGKLDDGWHQVTSELTYERSGSDRWLSTFHLLKKLIDIVGPKPEAKEAEAIGRLIAHLWTLQQMSMSIAGMLEVGLTPNVEAAVVKDLGTQFEKEIPDVARHLVPYGERVGANEALLDFNETLDHAIAWAPALSIRGGTREILRGIIARELGLR